MARWLAEPDGRHGDACERDLDQGRRWRRPVSASQREQLVTALPGRDRGGGRTGDGGSYDPGQCQQLAAARSGGMRATRGKMLFKGSSGP